VKGSKTVPRWSTAAGALLLASCAVAISPIDELSIDELSEECTHEKLSGGNRGPGDGFDSDRRRGLLLWGHECWLLSDGDMRARVVVHGL